MVGEVMMRQMRVRMWMRLVRVLVRWRLVRRRLVLLLLVWQGVAFDVAEICEGGGQGGGRLFLVD